MLFRVLHPDIFTVFAGPNRRLYEDVLVTIYEHYFRSDLIFPLQGEMIAVIYDYLAEHPIQWRDEGDDGAVPTFDEISGRRRGRLRRRGVAQADKGATTEAMSRARYIYARFNATGWLEESQYGLKVTVEMPAGAMRLVEFLCSLREGLSEQLGGLVVEVKNALESVRVAAKDNALGLHKAATDATSFGRYLRSMLSSLREIDRQILESENVEERLHHYFEGFIEELLLKDYAAIATTAHPYRFRHRILEALQSLEDAPIDIQNLTEAYFDARLAADLQAAREVVYDDLHKISRVFDRIDDAFRRIQQHRGRLEARLRNTVRYAGRRSSKFLERSEKLLLGLDVLFARTGPFGPANLLGPMEAARLPVSPLLLARPRGARISPSGGEIGLPNLDPLQLLRRRLERDYLNRLMIRPSQVVAFLERQVEIKGKVHADALAMNTVDDFLAFEALRLSVPAILEGSTDDAFTRALSAAFVFEKTPDQRVENEWLRCEGFHVSRKAPAAEQSHAA